MSLLCLVFVGAIFRLRKSIELISINSADQSLRLQEPNSVYNIKMDGLSCKFSTIFVVKRTATEFMGGLIEDN